MKILSIDLASKQSGLALFDDGQLIKYDILKPKTTLKEAQRLPIIESIILDWIIEWCPDLVLLENPCGGQEDIKSPQNNWLTMFTLAKVHGVINNLLEKKSIQYEYISPSSWQNIVGIHKRSRDERKAGAKAYAIKKYGLKDNLEQDIYDACCMFAARELEKGEWIEWN